MFTPEDFRTYIIKHKIFFVKIKQCEKCGTWHGYILRHGRARYSGLCKCNPPNMVLIEVTWETITRIYNGFHENIISALIEGIDLYRDMD